MVFLKVTSWSRMAAGAPALTTHSRQPGERGGRQRGFPRCLPPHPASQNPLDIPTRELEHPGLPTWARAPGPEKLLTGATHHEDAAVAVSVDAPELEVGLGRHGGRPGGAVDERELPEAAALADAGYPLSVHVHLGGSVRSTVAGSHHGCEGHTTGGPRARTMRPYPRPLAVDRMPGSPAQARPRYPPPPAWPDPPESSHRPPRQAALSTQGRRAGQGCRRKTPAQAPVCPKQVLPLPRRVFHPIPIDPRWFSKGLSFPDCTPTSHTRGLPWAALHCSAPGGRLPAFIHQPPLSSPHAQPAPPRAHPPHPLSSTRAPGLQSMGPDKIPFQRR